LFWLSQNEVEILSGIDWLSEKEQSVLSGLRFPKRRADWLLGRWTAKRCLCGYLEIPAELSLLKNLEIMAAPDGAPEPFREGERLPLSLSISHSMGTGLAAVDRAEAAVGCDVERISPNILEFIDDYITPSERLLIEGSSTDRRAAAATLIWCAKESALKSLREGLRRDTRSIEVTLGQPRPAEAWEGFVVTCSKTGSIFSGWWRAERGYIWALTHRDCKWPLTNADEGAK
jgi:4'-phosphopantetheinyl transferase